MFRLIIIYTLTSLFATSTFAQTDTTEFRKTGFTFGALPAIAYDNDLGLQYGALVNMYWYGDGSSYPLYNHSLYLECSRYTAGTTLIRGYFDSRKLIPQCRTTIDLTCLNDVACDFTGFNGKESRYNTSFIDEDNADYKSSVFYAHKRYMTRGLFNIKKRLSNNNNYFWQIGANVFKMDIGTVNKSKLRHSVPDIKSVYDKYVDWGLIAPKEADGGTDTYFRFGLGIDTRNNEVFATKGMWTEILLATAPQFGSTDNNKWGRITIYHRQYFNIYNQQTVVAYRIGWQHKLWGNIPFYLLPHWNTGILTAATSQGIGGGKTMRGVVRNRIVGDGSLMANIELRHIFGHFILFNQKISIGTNLFSDLGLVTQKHHIDLSKVPTDEFRTYFTGKSEKLHASLGVGLKIAMNDNFVVSTDWGKAQDKNDGTSGFYVMMNYLF